MHPDLFDALPVPQLQPFRLDEGAVLLRGFAGSDDRVLLEEVKKIIAVAPLRHMITPGGFRMSVAMSNCGQAGWVSDPGGYRYDAIDPETGKPWPALPAVFMELADRAARSAGYENFIPDVCLVNCYVLGTQLSLHQDKDERDPSAPIVSVSLGLPAVFLFGGSQRSIRPRRYTLLHGDVVVWGGPARYHFHGIAPLAEGHHAIAGRKRINLTFRKAL